MKYIRCTSGQNPNGSIVDLLIRTNGIAGMKELSLCPTPAPQYPRTEIVLEGGVTLMIQGTVDDLMEAIHEQQRLGREIVELRTEPVVWHGDD